MTVSTTFWNVSISGSRRRPLRGEVLVQCRQGGVGERRSPDSALRSAGHGVPVETLLGEDTRLQERRHPTPHTLVPVPSSPNCAFGSWCRFGQVVVLPRDAQHSTGTVNENSGAGETPDRWKTPFGVAIPRRGTSPPAGQSATRFRGRERGVAQPNSPRPRRLARADLGYRPRSIRPA